MMEVVKSKEKSKLLELFRRCDREGNGTICEQDLLNGLADFPLTSQELSEVFQQLDIDGDGKIDLMDFSIGFRKVFASKYDEDFDLDSFTWSPLDVMQANGLLSGQDQVLELYHHLNSHDNPHAVRLLENVLFSVIRDIKGISHENQRLDECLRRTCDQHAQHMEHLDEEMEQQMSRLEARIRQEERTRAERTNLELQWQIESKNKDMQALNTKIQKLEGKLKRKEPEESNLREQLDEKVQENRHLKSQITDAQTSLAVLRSELAQLRTDYQEKSDQLQGERQTVQDCIQEQESLTRQLQLLHEANKKLHDTNDDLRSALETRRSSVVEKSPLKRHSIHTLSSITNETLPSPAKTRKRIGTPTKSPAATSRPSSANESGNGSRRNTLTSPRIVDGEGINEESLYTELMKLNENMVSPEDEDELDSAYNSLPLNERSQMAYNLKILHDTNKRLCESNDDLRLALEALAGKRTKDSKRKSGDPCKRNPSFHSDYGSVSSGSATPVKPKSEEDMGDGADGSSYEGEFEVEGVISEFASVKEEPEDADDSEDDDEYDMEAEELAKLVEMTSSEESETCTDSEDECIPKGVRGPIVGADSSPEQPPLKHISTPIEKIPEPGTPERMYKLVLAGDAAVGKSSFILRLCKNRFHTALNSTLGVDFQMKTMVVDGRTVALQLWDTAGQERFRSIAKSYFRKVDGVLLLYDVTCETSFLDVRDWVEAIEESSTKEVPIMLCGNKVDLRDQCEAEGKSVITTEMGLKLAKEFDALFLETSCKDNKNITEACDELARQLSTIEDNEVEQAGLRLTENSGDKKKKSCC